MKVQGQGWNWSHVRASPISLDQEVLWSSGVLGEDDPNTLWNTAHISSGNLFCTLHAVEKKAICITQHLTESVECPNRWTGRQVSVVQRGHHFQNLPERVGSLPMWAQSCQRLRLKWSLLQCCETLWEVCVLHSTIHQTSKLVQIHCCWKVLHSKHRVYM